MTAWNYSVLLTEASGTSADATLVYDLQQALGVWQRISWDREPSSSSSRSEPPRKVA